PSGGWIEGRRGHRSAQSSTEPSLRCQATVAVDRERPSGHPCTDVASARRPAARVSPSTERRARMNLQRFPERAGRAARDFLHNGRSSGSTAERIEHMNRLDVAAAAQYLANLPEAKALPAISRPELHHAADIVAALPTDHAARLLRNIAYDRVT